MLQQKDWISKEPWNMQEPPETPRCASLLSTREAGCSKHLPCILKAISKHFTGSVLLLAQPVWIAGSTWKVASEIFFPTHHCAANFQITLIAWKVNPLT